MMPFTEGRPTNHLVEDGQQQLHHFLKGGWGDLPSGPAAHGRARNDSSPKSSPLPPIPGPLCTGQQCQS
ncbi:hypothetical protein GJAV_G00240770 [Gymnothorax javanicus]|nr:hypothetical protein GJAV_G00240770 [Gymnothorax javanicus]